MVWTDLSLGRFAVKQSRFRGLAITASSRLSPSVVLSGILSGAFGTQSLDCSPRAVCRLSGGIAKHDLVKVLKALPQRGTSFHRPFRAFQSSTPQQKVFTRIVIHSESSKTRGKVVNIFSESRCECSRESRAVNHQANAFH